METLKDKISDVVYRLQKLVSKSYSDYTTEAFIIDIREILQEYKHLPDLKESWENLQKYPGKFVISIIGMINSGKSSLANILAGKELFKVGCVRETEISQYEEIGDDIILCDLPGVGFSDKDDREILCNIERADLLIYVFAANNSLPKDWYEFIKKSIPKDRPAILVINKTDSAFPGIHGEKLDKILLRFQQNLLNGNPVIGEMGIKDLLPPEVSIIPFSCVDFANGNCSQHKSLWKVIRQQKIRDKGMSLELRKLQMLAMHVVALSKLDNVSKKVFEVTSELMNTTIKRYSEILHRKLDAIIHSTGTEICQLLQKRFDKMEDENEDRQRLIRISDKSEKKITELLKDMKHRWKKTIKKTYSSFFARDIEVEVDSTCKIKEKLYKSIDHMWNFFDDLYFSGINSKTEKRSKKAFKRLKDACELLEEWRHRNYKTHMKQQFYSEQNEENFENLSPLFGMYAELLPIEYDMDAILHEMITLTDVPDIN